LASIVIGLSSQRSIGGSRSSSALGPRQELLSVYSSTKFDYGVTITCGSAIDSNDLLSSVDHPSAKVATPHTEFSTPLQRIRWRRDTSHDCATLHDEMRWVGVGVCANLASAAQVIFVA
jgi:hypothetical protein